jgi:hypothetical protein
MIVGASVTISHTMNPFICPSDLLFGHLLLYGEGTWLGLVVVESDKRSLSTVLIIRHLHVEWGLALPYLTLSAPRRSRAWGLIGLSHRSNLECLAKFTASTLRISFSTARGASLLHSIIFLSWVQVVVWYVVLGCWVGTVVAIFRPVKPIDNCNVTTVMGMHHHHEHVGLEQILDE